MMASERYLFCYAGDTAFLVRAHFLRHIWTRSTPTPDEFQRVEAVDLRRRQGQAARDEGVALGLDLPGGADVLLVDRIGGFSDVSEDEFLALPSVFEFARQTFDAACRRAIGGVYPLRLRLGA
ncbi:MAG: hypothetical protein ABSC72_05560 [Methylovirgula sp.]|jgi:hypothetical protein